MTSNKKFTNVDKYKKVCLCFSNKSCRIKISVQSNVQNAGILYLFYEISPVSEQLQLNVGRKEYEKVATRIMTALAMLICCMCLSLGQGEKVQASASYSDLALGKWLKTDSITGFQ